jgi:hypothetical protein
MNVLTQANKGRITGYQPGERKRELRGCLNGPAEHDHLSQSFPLDRFQQLLDDPVRVPQFLAVTGLSELIQKVLFCIMRQGDKSDPGAESIRILLAPGNDTELLASYGFFKTGQARLDGTVQLDSQAGHAQICNSDNVRCPGHTFERDDEQG